MEFCKSQPVVDFKNRQQGFLHYFQADRLYWIYPAGWYLEFALCFSLWWKKTGRGIWTALPVKILALCLVLFPTMREIEENSSFYENVNQWNNGSRRHRIHFLEKLFFGRTDAGAG